MQISAYHLTNLAVCGAYPTGESMFNRRRYGDEFSPRRGLSGTPSSLASRQRLNDPQRPWKGTVWSITVANFIVVDDFEDYTDDVSSRIFQTWRDGYGFSEPAPGYPGNGTGSAVGYSQPPFAEQTIVHGGGQSMPLAYDNTGAGGKARYSETQREWPSPQDWTRNNVKALTLWFYGDPNNTAEQLYVAVEDNAGHVKVVNHPELDSVLGASWHEWNIELTQFSAAGVNPKAIKKMYIGLGNRSSPKAGGTGTIYIDDIRAYPSRCVPSKAKPAASLNNDCVVDSLDVAMMAQEWLVRDVAEDVWKGTFSSQDIGAPTPAGGFSFDGNTYPSRRMATTSGARLMPSTMRLGR